MGSLFQIVNTLSEILEILVGLLLSLMVAIVLIVLRYLFDTGIVGANEMVTILFVYTSALGAAVASNFTCIGFASEYFRFSQEFPKNVLLQLRLYSLHQQR